MIGSDYLSGGALDRRGFRLTDVTRRGQDCRKWVRR